MPMRLTSAITYRKVRWMNVDKPMKIMRSNLPGKSPTSCGHSCLHCYTDSISLYSYIKLNYSALLYLYKYLI